VTLPPELRSKDFLEKEMENSNKKGEGQPQPRNNGTGLLRCPADEPDDLKFAETAAQGKCSNKLMLRKVDLSYGHSKDIKEKGTVRNSGNLKKMTYYKEPGRGNDSKKELGRERLKGKKIGKGNGRSSKV